MQRMAVATYYMVIETDVYIYLENGKERKSFDSLLGCLRC